MKITIGFVALANTVSEQDARAVQTLRQAGAVVYVKTTMPQTGMVNISNLEKQDRQR
jgi:amidase